MNALEVPQFEAFGLTMFPRTGLCFKSGQVLIGSALTPKASDAIFQYKWVQPADAERFAARAPAARVFDARRISPKGDAFIPGGKLER